MEAASARRSQILTRGRRTDPGSAPTPSRAGEPPINGVVRCGSCGRFPLIGELVTRHGGSRSSRGEETWACPTCEGDGRAARLGAATAIERVRSLGGAANVRPA